MQARNSPDGRQHKWFAVGVTPRHEKTVSTLLDHKGYETFLPLYKRLHQYARRTREFQLPLFPGYLFCRVDPTDRLPILTTPGVIRLLGDGRVPIPIEDGEIAALQMAVLAGIPLVPHAFWRAGQKGRIGSGPLTGVEGIIVDAEKPYRLVLSITLLQRSVLLEIDSDNVVAVENDARPAEISAVRNGIAC